MNPQDYDNTKPIPVLNCISYSPFYHFFPFDPHDATRRIEPEWVEGDLKHLSQYTRCIRIYTTLNGMEIVPEIAQRYDIRVIAGSYFHQDEAQTEKDIQGLIRIANRYANISHVIVGNETLYYDEAGFRDRVIGREEIIRQVERVKKAVAQPVSISEASSDWLNPEVIADIPDHVEFIAAHILPYWSGVPFSESLTQFLQRYRELQAVYPSREIVVTETGWPTTSAPWGGAKANRWSTYAYVQGVRKLAQEHNIQYVYFEAYDQPWKMMEIEGRTGSHWGLFDIYRTSRFITPQILHRQLTLTYTDLAYIALSLLLFLSWSGRNASINLPSVALSALLANLLGYFFVSVGKTFIDEYLYLYIWKSAVLIPGALILAASLIYKTHCVLMFMGGKPFARRFETMQPPLPDVPPFVSIHIPCCNENPDHVIAAVQSLLAQDYPKFEIVVVDNNTTEERLWKPLEAFCNKHPEHVKFFHVARLEGFKAGALRYALEHTAAEATVIGVIDADYLVERDWLKDCVPHLDAKTGAVQAPQDYLQEFDSVFMRSIYDEYTGFFRIGMVDRNESNAIIQHGTMLLLSREALSKAGGWQTDTIVEDTDLGLRLLIAGYECRYINRCYGRGRLPQRFSEYRKQRFRWAYGAMRCLIKFAPYLLGWKKGLSVKQRGHFILGWVPWIGNIFHPLFVAGALMLSVFYVRDFKYINTAALFTPLLVYVALDLLYSAYLTRRRMGLNWERTGLSFIAGASLVFTIARGVFVAVFYSRYPFKVTRKGAKPSATKSRWEDIPFFSSLLMLGFAYYFLFSDSIPPDLWYWIVLLITLSIPGIAWKLMLWFEGLAVPRERM